MTGLQVMKRVKDFYRELSIAHPNLREPVFNF
jgi:hypothetical protein